MHYISNMLPPTLCTYINLNQIIMCVDVRFTVVRMISRLNTLLFIAVFHFSSVTAQFCKLNVYALYVCKTHVLVIW